MLDPVVGTAVMKSLPHHVGQSHQALILSPQGLTVRFGTETGADEALYVNTARRPFTQRVT